MSQKIVKLLRLFPYIHKILYFNFHYLPFSQAIKLPIWLYKPKFKSTNGTIRIVGGVKMGMIRLGFDTVCLYPSSGITFDNNGTIVFNGNCCIGNNSFLSVGSHGVLSFGNGFSATTSLKIASYSKIKFGDSVSVGWNCMFIDTDFHSMIKGNGTKSKGFGDIVIGSNNWFGNNCMILKNVMTPNFTTIAAGTQLSQSCKHVPPYSIIGNDKSVRIIKTGWYRDFNNDDIVYNIYD